MLAVASESLVKLLVFIAVGDGPHGSAFGGLEDLFRRGSESPPSPRPSRSASTADDARHDGAVGDRHRPAPAQFHVTVVETTTSVRPACFILAFSALPIAINLRCAARRRGRLTFADGAINRDMTVLACRCPCRRSSARGVCYARRHFRLDRHDHRRMRGLVDHVSTISCCRSLVPSRHDHPSGPGTGSRILVVRRPLSCSCWRSDIYPCGSPPKRPWVVDRPDPSPVSRRSRRRSSAACSGGSGSAKAPSRA